MKRNNITGRILIICGSVLSILGVILFMIKGSSIVSIMSMPVLLIGIIIWYKSKINLDKKIIADQ